MKDDHAALCGPWPPTRLESDRLILRPPVYVDGPSLHTMLNDPEVCRFLPYKPSASLAATRYIIALWAAAAKNGMTTYAVCLRLRPHEPFGIIQVQSQAESNEVELGAMLRSSAWGQGYAREAFRLVRQSAPPGATMRFSGDVDVQNSRAIAMLSKIGLAPPEVREAHRVHPTLSTEPRACLLFNARVVNARLVTENDSVDSYKTLPG